MIVNKYNNGGGSSSGGSADYATLAGEANKSKLLEGASGLPESGNTGDVVAVAPAPALLSTRGTKSLRSANTALGIYQYDGSEWNPIGGETPDFTSLKPVSELPESGETGEVVAKTSSMAESIVFETSNVSFEGNVVLVVNAGDYGSLTITAIDGGGVNVLQVESIEGSEDYIVEDGKYMFPTTDEGYIWAITQDEGSVLIRIIDGDDNVISLPYETTTNDCGAELNDVTSEVGVYQYDGVNWKKVGSSAYKIELSTNIPDYFTEYDIANLNAFYSAVEADPSIANTSYAVINDDIYTCVYSSYDGVSPDCVFSFVLTYEGYIDEIELTFENGEFTIGEFYENNFNYLYPSESFPADPAEGQIANYNDGNGNIGLYRYDGTDWQPYGGGPQGPQGPAGQNGTNGSQGPQGPQGPAGSGGAGDNTSLMPIQELPVSGETGEVVALAYDIERPTAPNSGSVYGGAIDAFIDAIEASPNGRVIIQNGDSSDWTDWGYFEKQNDVYGFYDYQADVWHPFDSMTEGWNDDIYWYPMQRIGDNVFFYDRRNDGSTFFTPSINMMFNVVGQVADGVYQYNGEEWIKIGENETYQVNLSTTAPDSFTQDDIDNLNAFFTKCAEDHSLPVRTFINAAGNIYHNSYVGFTDNQNAEMYFILAFQDYLEQMNLYFADGEYSNGSLTGNSIGSPYNEYGNLLGVGLHDTEADKVIKFDIDNDPDDYTIGSYEAVGEGDNIEYVKEKSIVTSTNIKRMVKITESDYDTLVNNDEVDDDTFYIVVPDPEPEP